MKFVLAAVIAGLLLAQCSLTLTQTEGQVGNIEQAKGDWSALFVGPKIKRVFDETTVNFTYNISVTRAPVNATSFKFDDLEEFLRTLSNRTYASLTDSIASSMSSATIVSVAVRLIQPNLLPAADVKANMTMTLVANFTVTITANRVGRSSIAIRVRTSDAENENDTMVGLTQVTVFREYRVIDMVFRWVITAFVIFVTFGMGCELDLHIIFKILRKPFAPLIGFCSQYILMPVIAIGIGQIFLASDEMKLFGFGMLAVGCSPGGGGSNMWTILLGGDLNLSMTMTAISTTLALGMMPLWLFLTAPLYVDVNKVHIPYEMIIIQLVQFVLPTLLGVGLKSWKPNIADKFKGPVRWGSLCFFVFMLTFGTWVNLYMFRTIGYFPHLLPIGGLLPWCGFLFGYVLAFILRQGHKRALTIGIETGIQNIGVPMLILRFAFPSPEGDIGAVMVMITAMFTPLPLYLALLCRGIYRCVKKIMKKNKKADSDSEDECDEKATPVNGQVDAYLNRTPHNSENVEAAPLSSFKTTPGSEYSETENGAYRS